MSQIEPQSSEEVPPPSLKNPKMKWWQKTLIGLAIILPIGGLVWYSVPTITKIGILIATPFVIFAPEENRYEEMYLVLDELNYENFGTVVSIEEDPYNIELSPTWIKVTIESDSENFEKLKERALAISKNDTNLVYDDCNISDTSVSCPYGAIRLYISLEKQNRIEIEVSK